MSPAQRGGCAFFERVRKGEISCHGIRRLSYLHLRLHICKQKALRSGND
jgi:DNA-binding transcriptional regulator YdaS (Cro superfamily)